MPAVPWQAFLFQDYQFSIASNDIKADTGRGNKRLFSSNLGHSMIDIFRDTQSLIIFLIAYDLIVISLFLD